VTEENHHVTEENPRLLRRGYLSVLHSRSLFFSPAPQSVLQPRPAVCSSAPPRSLFFGPAPRSSPRAGPIEIMRLIAGCYLFGLFQSTTSIYRFLDVFIDFGLIRVSPRQPVPRNEALTSA